MSQAATENAIETALQHHRAGRLQQAERIYRQTLEQQPEHFVAMRYLGVIAHQVGRYDLAVDLLRKTIAFTPYDAETHNDLGNALKRSGRLEEAIASFRQVVNLRPDCSEAHANLGASLQEKGQLDEAIAAYRRAIVLRSDFHQAYFNLGNALKDRGQLEEAVAAYRQAINIAPRFAQAYHNLGNVLMSQGQVDAGLAAYRQAIAIDPHLPHAHFSLGRAAKDHGGLNEAVAAYTQAIGLRPDFPDACYELGNTFRLLGQLDDAIAAYRRALAIDPDFPEACNNLGNALKDSGRLDEGIEACRRAITLRPNYSDAHGNVVYMLHLHPGYGARAIADEQANWNRRYAEPMRQYITAHANDRSPDRRLRIGYVSADLRDHPVGRHLLPILANHDRHNFEVFAYASASFGDDMNQRLRSHADAWRDIVGLSDAQAADLIRQDQIDILVDLSLHTANNRLLVFARKPAPVQVTWLGYPASTGLRTIDYRLSDPHMDPPGMDESIYSERTIRLPDSFWCYDPLDARQVPVNPLPAIEPGVVTFGCLNNFCKVNEPVLKLWAQVLRAAQGTRLLMLSPDGSCRQRILDVMSKQGIDPARVEFISRQSRTSYLESYHRIDIFLDTFPYNGHTTGLDSLWMGVPVVTLMGQTAVSRAGFSHLSNLGLTELAADSHDRYVQIALGLANDLTRLQELRSTLRQRMETSPLTDAPTFVRNIEAVYRRMWLGEVAGDNRQATSNQ